MLSIETPTRTVLLVDDDVSQLKLYSWILARGGYRAITAVVGSSSVTFPNNRQIDVAVMDYRLHSQLTTLDVLREIRAEYPGVPVLLLSEVFELPKEMAGHVEAFVTKGEPELLLEKIGELAEAASQERIRSAGHSA